MSKNSKTNPFADYIFDEPVDRSSVNFVENIGNLRVGSEYSFEYKKIPMTGEIKSIGINFKDQNGNAFNAMIVLAGGYKHLISLVS